MANEKNLSCYAGVFASITLVVLIFIIYSNTFNASWHMDDYSNITHNTQAHIKNLQQSSLFETFFLQDGHSRKLFRPVSRLTFAINWYFCKNKVFGYHMVNVLIHFLTAFFLFLTVYNILDLPFLKGKYIGDKYSIALLTGVFWSINPVQTQAVTYIVQRMTSLATAFYVLTIFFYLKGRIVHSHSKKIVFFLCCFLSFLLALASKENSTILPISLVLLEICFFQDIGQLSLKKVSGYALLMGVFILTVLAIFFLGEHSLSVPDTFEARPFNLWQRIITEPRVFVLYLTQMFYPVPTRLSIEHDFVISTSLFTPWSTLPCILIIIVLIGFGLSQIRKRPILSFGLLFFFLNHLMESSVTELMPISEHRNYLPSLFLFFPVAVGIIWLIDYYHMRRRFLYYSLISFFTLLLLGLGSGTYIRNMAWISEKTLWEDAMAKAPPSAFPPYNLARHHYEVLGDHDKAMDLYEKSLSLRWQDTAHKAEALNSIAGIYSRRGEPEKAMNYYKKALAIAPRNETSSRQLAVSLTKLGKWDEASRFIDSLLSRFPEEEEYLNLKGFVLLKQERPLDALPYLKRCLKLNPAYRKAMINIGAILSSMGKHERAEWFLSHAHQLYPKDTLTLIWLIEINLRAGDEGDVDKYGDELFSVVGVNEFTSIAKRLSEHTFMVPESECALIRELGEKIWQKSDEVEELADIIKRRQRQ
jgi:Tfp pilus assembly protein PilF